MGMAVTRDEAVWLRKQHAGGRVVAACGCFDIFHVGHLEYLEQAARQGDALFVGVNTDLSVRSNKGRFPYFHLRDRMRLLAALNCVDYVFPFSEKTYSLTLFLLRPSVLARGADASIKGFPEEKVCRSLGIEVIQAGTKKRASSTELRTQLEPGGISRPGRRSEYR